MPEHVYRIITDRRSLEGGGGERVLQQAFSADVWLGSKTEAQTSGHARISPDCSLSPLKISQDLPMYHYES